MTVTQGDSHFFCDGKRCVMKKMYKYLVVLLVVLGSFSVLSYAQEAQNTEKAQDPLIPIVANIQSEADAVLKESKSVEREALLKTQAAEVAKEEYEGLKKQAKEGDKEAKGKLPTLEEKFKTLQKEANNLMDKAQLAKKKAELYQTIKAEQRANENFQSRLIKAAIVIGIGFAFFLVLKLIMVQLNRFITKSNENSLHESDTVQRLRTFSRLIYWVGSIIIVGTVIYLTLDYFGFNLTPLLAGAGIVGLSFGFGGQYLIRDIISGIFILAEGQFHINDVIKINDLGGLVEDVNLRVTKLRDLEGRVIYIPNGEIKAVINYTQEWSRALFNVGVAYKENVDHVMEVIVSLGKEMREDKEFGKYLLEDLDMLGVDDFGSSQVTIKFFIKTLPLKQWTVAREFKRRIKNKFDELGIEIPFPHQTMYWGTGQDNDFFKNYFEQSTK